MITPRLRFRLGIPQAAVLRMVRTPESMSLGIVFKGTEGIVLAADSRVTLFGTLPSPGLPNSPQVVVPATFDNASKMLRVKGQKFVGAVTLWSRLDR